MGTIIDMQMQNREEIYLGRLCEVDMEYFVRNHRRLDV